MENNSDIDKDKLAKTGPLLSPTGGKDIAEMTRKALAGEWLIV
jgi:hypothetical protein